MFKQFKQKLFVAGCGNIGSYSHCCWQVKGVGQFKPLEGSSPVIGEQGTVESVAEYRVEFILAKKNYDSVKQVHVKEFIGDDPLTDHAVTGTFWFRNKSVYLKSLEQLYKKDIKVNNEYYVDSVVNEAIELGYKVKYFEVDHYICWGTPNDLQTYQYWQRFFNKVDWHPYNYDRDYFSS